MPKKYPLLVPANRHDIPLINRWLVLPSIRRWWGSPVNTQIEMRLGIFVPDEIGQVFLIQDKKRGSVGLVSAIHTRAMARSPIGWPKYLPSQAWEIGILIAERMNRRRGLGTKALLEAQDLVFGTSGRHGCDPVFAWIEKENVASLATFARLGYRRVYEQETKTYSSALLQYDRDFETRNAGA